MAIGSKVPSERDEYPPLADLRRDVYQPLPVIPPTAVGEKGIAPGEAANHARAVLESVNDALESADGVAALTDLFFRDHCYWRDILALTYHIRTIRDAGPVVSAFSETRRRRGASRLVFVEGSAVFAPVTPTLKWINFAFKFETSAPGAACSGRITLLPQARDGDDGSPFEWKIWILSTWLDEFQGFPADTERLTSPGRDLTGSEDIETDVFIIGGGNSGIVLAARLKALGVEAIIADKNPKVGDNWALRYECMRFHVHKKYCNTPFLEYPDDVPMLPDREQLADHMKRYAAAFRLNMLNSTTIRHTSYDLAAKRWTVKLNTPAGERTVRARCFVQSTGIACVRPRVPDIPGRDGYRGISVHSTQFWNAKQLKEKGVKSVLIVGSANTAFDVAEDCCNAELETTMVVRSPTWLFPWAYCLMPRGPGIYETLPAEIADNLQLTGPLSVGGQLAIMGMKHLAAEEPERYAPLAKAGFPVYDSLDDRADLMHHIFERGGGHYNEIGEAVNYIIAGKIGLKARVEPVAYTATGLRFSDGSEADADAVVWCTGFSDKNARDLAAEILGGASSEGTPNGATNGVSGTLEPHAVAARMDATWGVDAEGEVRGMWKRHLLVDNFWVFGGTTTHQRFYSRFVAMQIKGSLEGILPEAYRGTPARGKYE